MTDKELHNIHKAIARIITIVAVMIVVYRIMLLIRRTVLLKTTKVKEVVMDTSNGLFKAIVMAVNGNAPESASNTKEKGKR